ncbi:MAG TPA: prepilin peptidase, partial [Bacilli bacterium]|nr:prepilin peptidase [Bacilli bacterium]
MSIINPPSHCPKCNNKIKWYDLVPILSFIILGGKCRKCKSSISYIYPIFELLTGILFVYAYIFFGFTLELLIAIIFISSLIIVAISDIKYMEIPDQIFVFSIPIIILIKILILFNTNNITIVSIASIALDIFISFVFIFLLKLLGDVLFKKESLGGGDIKLMMLIGLVVGYELSIIVIFLAAFLALPIALIILITKNKNILPFGPFLALASIIIYFSKIDIEQILNMIK